MTKDPVLSPRPEWLESLLKRLESYWPSRDWVNSKVMVAVSGGADSVAVLRLLIMIRQQVCKVEGATGEIIVGHCNHETRPECKLEAEFVKSIADEFGVDCVVVERSAGVNAGAKRMSEDKLREFRYRGLMDAARSAGARYLVTGHHFDDQVETVLFRIFRGTGISGLQGVLRVRVDDGLSIVRPLLKVSRREIVQFLNAIGQTYCEDESNRDLEYDRNFIRNEIVPRLRQRFDGKVDGAIERLSEQAEEYVEFLDHLSLPFLSGLKMGGQHLAELDVAKLRNQHGFLVRHVVQSAWRQLGLPEREMSREKWKQVSELLAGESSRGPDSKARHLQFPGNVTLFLDGDRLTFANTDQVSSPRVQNVPKI